MQKEVGGNAPDVETVAADDAHGAHGEKNGHRIVAAGFKFENGFDARLNIQIMRAQNGKNRRGVGRRDDDAEQQRNLKAQADDIAGEEIQKNRREQDTQRIKDTAAKNNGANLLPFGAQTAGEQNKGQSDGTGVVGKPGIAEFDTAGTV